MADDITVSAGVFSDTIAAWDDGTRKHQRIVLSAGDDFGCTPYYNDGTATLTQIKASAGQVYFIHAMNLRATVAYLQLFNVANGSITIGTTTPTNEFVLPTQGDTNGAGFCIPLPVGLAYGTAINYAITTTKGGATAVTADECLLNIGYA